MTKFSRVPFEVVAVLIAVAVSAATLGGVFGFALLMQHFAAGSSAQPLPQVEKKPAQVAASGALVEQGKHLFLMNCAHCHADDATGDEGPDLHGVRKSDARFTAIIKNGIKGEMPKFGEKLHDDDVKALIAFLRSLK